MIAKGKLGEHDAAHERVEGERAFIACPAPFAPGKPTTLALAVEPALSIQLKAVGSKRRDDGLYLVQARIVMLRKHEREQLAALVAAAG
jgi:hypothetical protein